MKTIKQSFKNLDKTTKAMTHQAVAINKDYWILVSTPCTKEHAEKFRGCQMKNETFVVKTVEEVNNHRFVIQ